MPKGSAILPTHKVMWSLLTDHSNPQLSGLTALTRLWLSDNQISDVAPLSDLTSLTNLWLGNNQIRPSEALISAVGPHGSRAIRLDSGDTKRGDWAVFLPPCSGLTSLRTLFLDVNQIRDVSPLSSLTALTNLRLRENQISDGCSGSGAPLQPASVQRVFEVVGTDDVVIRNDLIDGHLKGLLSDIQSEISPDVLHRRALGCR